MGWPRLSVTNPVGSSMTRRLSRLNIGGRTSVSDCMKTWPIRASMIAKRTQGLPQPQETSVNCPAKLGPRAAASLRTVRKRRASGWERRLTGAGLTRVVSATGCWSNRGSFKA